VTPSLRSAVACLAAPPGPLLLYLGIVAMLMKVGMTHLTDIIPFELITRCQGTLSPWKCWPVLAAGTCFKHIPTWLKSSWTLVSASSYLKRLFLGKMQFQSHGPRTFSYTRARSLFSLVSLPTSRGLEFQGGELQVIKYLTSTQETSNMPITRYLAKRYFLHRAVNSIKPPLRLIRSCHVLCGKKS